MGELQRNSYRIVAGRNAMQQINQDYGRMVAGYLCTYGMPEGFIPGKNEDRSKGYDYGSEIGTKDALYRCLDGTVAKAVWVKISGQITEVSFDSARAEAQENIEAKKKATKEDLSKKTDVLTSQEDEEDFEEGVAKSDKIKDISDEKQANKSTPDTIVSQASKETNGEFDKPPIPKEAQSIDEWPEMYGNGWLKQNGVETMPEMFNLLEEEKIRELKFFNEAREAKLRKWLVTEGLLNE